MRFVLLSIVAIHCSACGGRVTSDSSSSDRGAATNVSAAPTAAPIDDAPPAPTPPPALDAGPAPEPAGTGGCQVVVITASTPSGGGPTIYTKQLSDPAEATVAFIDSTPAGIFTVTCLAGSETRLRATFGPYTSLGDYPIAVGALELGGHSSDRACSVNLSSSGPGVLRGFVSCPTVPYSDANVFAQTGPPIGLAAFDAKVR